MERITEWQDVDGNRFTAHQYRDRRYNLPLVDILTEDMRVARKGMIMDRLRFIDWALNEQGWRRVPDISASGAVCDNR